MIFIPDLYQHVPMETYVQAQCSPAPPSSIWRGVIISAPQRIIPDKGENLVIPICGHYVVPVLAAMDGPGLTVHVRRIEAELVLSGLITDQGENEPVVPPPPGAPRPKRESFEGVTTGGYFNIDAQRHLKTRLVPGIYEVTVSYAGMVSNSTQIEIKAP